MHTTPSGLLPVRTVHDIGAAIKERRRVLALTQRDLAALIGTSRQWVVDAEAGKPRIEASLLLSALNALGIVVSLAEASSLPAADAQAVPLVDIDAVIDRSRRRDGG